MAMKKFSFNDGDEVTVTLTFKVDADQFSGECICTAPAGRKMLVLGDDYADVLVKYSTEAYVEGQRKKIK